MASEEIKIKNYDRRFDRFRVEDLERRCMVGRAENALLFDTETPFAGFRTVLHTKRWYFFNVAELNKELVGVIQGCIKIVTFRRPPKNQAAVGYILGLRVSPIHRRKGIGLHLVQKLEEWFISNHVDFSYMATEKDNVASTKLFNKKLGYLKFRTPAILVNGLRGHPMSISHSVEIVKLNIEQAERLYRKFMSSTEFFPHDIDKILKNKLSLGTWVAYPQGESCSKFDSNGGMPTSWAMLSVWNSGNLFKLKVGKASPSCLMYTTSSKLIDYFFPCFKFPSLPDMFNPFGFYFMYGLYREGPRSGILMGSLCRFVHNIAAKNHNCKVIVTEVGGSDTLRRHIPHWRLLSCPEDLWCVKAMKSEEKHALLELKRAPHPRALFMDPSRSMNRYSNVHSVSCYFLVYCYISKDFPNKEHSSLPCPCS